MKLNIFNTTHDDIKIIMTELLNTGCFKQMDVHRLDYCREDSNLKYFGLTLYPELLWYEENNGMKITPWIKCEFDFETHDELIKYTDFIKSNIFPHIKLKPFKDEDAFKQYFSKKGCEAGFYLNPDYPDGYWENHSL